MPELLEFYKDMAGMPAALKLAQEYGGTTLYLPAPDSLTDGHTLVQKLGLEDARLLCKEFGPGEIIVPMGPAKKKRVTDNDKIRALLDDKSLSNNDIARKCGCTERYVRMIRNGTHRWTKHRPKPLPLFPE